MEAISERKISGSKCVNVFKHETEEEISEAFTELWTQIINKRENQEQIYILQTKASDL